MAFKMDGEMILPASRQQVWAGLNDPEVLRVSIKGCQKLERVGENAFAAEVKMKIGPVSSVFNGRVALCDLDPPNSYRIEGQGDGGAAGFAKGGAVVRLSEVEGGTLLRYDVNAEIGGRLAQLGGRLINGVAKKQADMFFEAFAAQFSGAGAKQADDGVTAVADAGLASGPASAGLPHYLPVTQPMAPWGWLLAIALAVVGGFLLGRSNADGWWALVMVLLALASAGAGFASASGGRRT
jgi:carbon monoxide dehydrogenase subunit G